eukprot:TRINITY_DN5674_c0_g1_i1.p1 TRINITY_DN5674_c0_g1~~TRINITY_DN5674_c0_g1_i1.p1  ORF type:complete len:301 (-),score=57.11 TRINITY_DN5674_c0_g1_i1:353-1225(-)
MTEVCFEWPRPLAEGETIFVAGSFNGWRREPMRPTTRVTLQPGTHEFKFVVVGADGSADWRCDEGRPTRRDAAGNTNNVLTVPAAHDPLAVTLCTFNLRCLTVDDRDNHWTDGDPPRREVMKSAFRKWTAEERVALYGTQECTPEHISALLSEDVLAPRWWQRHGTGRFGDDYEEHCCVFWNAERLYKVDAGNEWLHDKPGHPETHVGGASFPRIITWAVFSTPECFKLAVCCRSSCTPSFRAGDQHAPGLGVACCPREERIHNPQHGTPSAGQVALSRRADGRHEQQQG